MENIKITVLISVAFLILSSVCEAENKITWMVTHWSPFMELDKSQRDVTGGTAGIQLKLLQASLKEYDHINREMSWNRFWAVVKRGEKICNCMVFKNPEREKSALFSIPVSIDLPVQIVMRKETFEQLGSPESLSFVELMHDKNLKGLLIKKRSYSAELDRLLEQYEEGSNIIRHIVNEQRYLMLLEKKRMDYVLEFPPALKDTISRFLPELKDKFVSVPITEASPYNYYYVACPKDEWGKAVIEKINASLKELRPTETYRSALELSYDGENLKRVLKIYDASFGTK